MQERVNWDLFLQLLFSGDFRKIQILLDNFRENRRLWRLQTFLTPELEDFMYFPEKLFPNQVLQSSVFQESALLELLDLHV